MARHKSRQDVEGEKRNEEDVRDGLRNALLDQRRVNFAATSLE
jgi:hypothetical protein